MDCSASIQELPRPVSCPGEQKSARRGEFPGWAMRRSHGGLHGAGEAFRLPEPVFPQQGCEHGHRAAHDGDLVGLAASPEPQRR